MYGNSHQKCQRGKWDIFFVLLLCTCASLAACGTSASDRSAAAPTPTVHVKATATAEVIATWTDAPTPYNTANQPDPIAPVGWKVYFNTTNHFTIEYPANWITDGATLTATTFTVDNYDPTTTYGAPIHPPLLSVQVSIIPNPRQLAPAAFLDDMAANDPTGQTPSASTQTRTNVTLAGRGALQVIQQPFMEIAFPAVDYYIPQGTAMVSVSQSDATNGIPSGVLKHMISSLAFTR